MQASKNNEEPIYRRVKFTPDYEPKAWRALVDSGISFDHVAKQEYIIALGQCKLLDKKHIPYQKLE
ncbi:MAG: hypothetical protein WAO91_02940 [Candidatus Nitrosotenuis sp.]